MAGKIREISIERAKALASQWGAQYEEHLRTTAITNRFKDATPAEVIHMWETCRNESGRKLSQPEFTALVERWLELFRAYPPADNGNDNEARGTSPQPKEPEPQDDTTLRMRDVERMTGFSKSTIKRRVADGTFPRWTKLHPTRLIGWPAHVVKDWLRTLQDQSRSTRP